MIMSATNSTRRNPVFWLMFALPGLAVVGGISTVVIAFGHADRALPPAYHWEGANLDADFERARRAASQGLSATLQVHAAGKWCRVRMADSPTSPASLRLLLTHSDDADLDRQLRLPRVRPGEYEAACEAIPDGKWRITLDDEAGTWTIRSQVDGALAHVELRARDPGGTS
jgi:hypothetical protein